jgi:hypothetical protein
MTWMMTAIVSENVIVSDKRIPGHARSSES